MKQTFASLEARAATSILGAARSMLPERKKAPMKGHGSRLTILRTLRDALKKAQKQVFRQKLRGRVLLQKLAECPRGAEKRPKTAAWLEQKDYRCPCPDHRSGDRLSYASARREVPAVVTAAEAYFGSWVRHFRRPK
jgi:hypothetical protein